MRDHKRQQLWRFSSQRITTAGAAAHEAAAGVCEGGEGSGPATAAVAGQRLC